MKTGPDIPVRVRPDTPSNGYPVLAARRDRAHVHETTGYSHGREHDYLTRGEHQNHGGSGTGERDPKSSRDLLLATDAEE